MANKVEAKQEPVKASYEETNDIKKLSVYVAIVNRGQGDAVTSLFQKNGSSAQFVILGNGTANKNVLDILGIEDNQKEVVLALIKRELIPDAKRELEAFFAASKRNKGIGFSIEMTSIIGVKLYRFLANVL